MWLVAIAIFVIIIIAIMLSPSKKEDNEIESDDWLDRAQYQQDKRFEYMNDAILHKDPNKEWDENKNRWIDKKEEARKERYRKYHENQPMNYDTWRAQQKEAIRKKHNITKNQTFDEWINDHKHDGFQGNRKEGIKWYPTGWTFNEKTKLWDPPDFVSKESSEKWRWDEEKKIWIDKEKETRMKRYRKYHEGQPPTFEEWKAQREKHNHPE